MTTTARKARGMRTQLVVARRLEAEGYVFAESAGSGRPGRDVLSVPPLCIEVKARTNLDPLAWVRQNRKETRPGEVPMVVFRPNGLGEESIDDWLVFRRFGDDLRILRDAGYLPEETA